MGSDEPVVAPLSASPDRLTRAHDVALLDLDGTIYLGQQVIAGAADAVSAARGSGMRMSFVTNNASRTPQEIAGHLSALGIPSRPDEVVTSAQAAADLLAGMVPAGSQVLIVGGQGLAQAVSDAGMDPVERTGPDVRAVVQGWSPDLAWSRLAEGAYALARGLPWVVTNTDRTLPTATGTAPGNGAFVELLAGVTGRQPDVVAGKPAPPLLTRSVVASAALRPLVVGDRLDTDIEGATNVGLPSLLVLTGVTRPWALLSAQPDRRPTYVSTDLTGLLSSQPDVSRSGDRWVCEGSIALMGTPRPDGSRPLTLGRRDPVPSDAVSGSRAVAPTGPDGPATSLDDLRALCAAAWAVADAGHLWHADPGLVAELDRLAPPTRSGQQPPQLHQVGE